MTNIHTILLFKCYILIFIIPVASDFCLWGETAFLFALKNVA